MPTKSQQNSALAVIKEIEDRIYAIREQRVMLDSDLAEIYGLEAKVLKQAVRRNLHRFPKDFMFELTLEETRRLESLRSQSVTLDGNQSKRGRYSKYKPFAFTEHGAVMLASVLNTPTAVEASIVVVRAFVKMWSILALHKDLAKRIDLVCDYFRWRNEDTHRNALNAHCYWLLRKQGKAVSEGTKFLEKKSVAEKNEFLWQNGTNFNDIPLWQKRGTGLYWEDYQKEGANKLTGETVMASRRRIKIDYDLPMRDEFSAFVREFLK